MTEEYPKDNSECTSASHNRHLCYFVSQGFHFSDPQEYKGMVEKPRFKCQHCGRVANNEKNLCKPANL